MHHQEERPTCKMTPDQLLGLQSYARAKTLSPEITVESNDGVPTVIASGTQESVPIFVEEVIVEAPPAEVPSVEAPSVEAPSVEAIDDVIAELEAKFVPQARTVPRVASRANELGAFVGFALFGAWTLVEVAMLLAR